VIAYNRRYMRFFYKLLPDFASGNIYYYPHAVCGSDRSIDRWVFIGLSGYVSLISKNHFLYKKYIKGEK